MFSYTAEIICGGEKASIKSIYPSMSLLTDTSGVIIDAEYNKDTNKNNSY